MDASGEHKAPGKNDAGLVDAGSNTFSPFSLAPDEIITEILSHCHDEHPPIHRQTLANIMAISRRIRTVAIDYPFLWTTIEIDARREWNEMCLRQSKAAPLDVLGWRHSLEPKVNEQPLELLRGHEWRFRTLDAKYLGGYAAVPFDGPAPQLESLVINCSDINKCSDLSAGTFSKPMRNLRNVELGMCRFPWTSDFLTNLTQLKICNALTKTTPQVLLSMLNRNPGLEHLTLDDMVLTIADMLAPSTSCQVVHLPRLRSLFIRGTSSGIYVWLIACYIYCPTWTRISFHAICSLPSVFSLGSCFCSIFVPPDANRHIKRLVIAIDEDSPVDLEMERSGGSETSFTLKLHVRPDSDSFGTLEGVVDHAASLPLSETEELELRAQDDAGWDNTFGASELMDLFPCIEQLRKLTFDGDEAVMMFSQMIMMEGQLPECYYGMARRLREHYEATDKQGLEPIDPPYGYYCLECTAFTETTLGHVQHIRLVGGHIDFLDLKAYLRYRDKLGKRLSRLELESCCELDEVQVDEYRALVGIVEWVPDEEGGGDGEDEEMSGE